MCPRDMQPSHPSAAVQMRTGSLQSFSLSLVAAAADCPRSPRTAAADSHTPLHCPCRSPRQRRPPRLRFAHIAAQCPPHPGPSSARRAVIPLVGHHLFDFVPPQRITCSTFSAASDQRLRPWSACLPRSAPCTVTETIAPVSRSTVHAPLCAPGASARPSFLLIRASASCGCFQTLGSILCPCASGPVWPDLPVVGVSIPEALSQLLSKTLHTLARCPGARCCAALHSLPA